ncbi:hypothetical protein [Streptomyces sp. NPDC093598]|uniref:hypothetical protein n=1 Tax=Streptomyces sp. NPDC093598 TaxID=3366046 RepID=UPI003812B7D3
MFSSRKIAAAAGVLGSFALVGVGTVQAFAEAGPGRCVDDGKGHVRCVQVSEYQVTSDKHGNVKIVNESTQTCPASNSQVTCVSSVVVPGQKS